MLQWNKLPFIDIDDVIFSVLESWPPKWHTPNLAELDRTPTQRRKDEAEKRCNEKVATKVRAVHEATKASIEQAKQLKL